MHMVHTMPTANQLFVAIPSEGFDNHSYFLRRVFDDQGHQLVELHHDGWPTETLTPSTVSRLLGPIFDEWWEN